MERERSLRPSDPTLGPGSPPSGAHNGLALETRSRRFCVRQNGKTFRDRTGSLRKILKKHAELVYISAPNVIPAQREEEEAAGGDGDTHTDDQRAWWFTVDPARAAPGERLFDSTAASALSVGFDDSVLAIARTLTELGPFHGILGFSQGASMASLILAMQRDNDARFSFGFAVLVSGFRSSSTEHRGAYAGGAVPTPSLHVRGLTDRVIAHQRSAELQQGYSHASELVHPGGTPLAHPLTRSPARSLTHPPIHSHASKLVQPGGSLLTCSPTCSLTHSLTYPLTHPRNSFTHPLTHPHTRSQSRE
ncbi:esterase OVCA2 isoform X3 [Lethenteron reissneri]|uniref:esterase OVCA2 isoform X3 n=1 Tax=Lethenteron reissneri TaxID=7753 RepID=UPI002AB64AC1|nr:esterase OVCA2 isoform X3 [Lethenteron reissneri]